LAREVYLHIGLPKTGTTYLQDVLWGSRKALRAEGVLLPGKGHREHLWAALDVQDRAGLAQRDPKAPGSFGRLAAEVRDWSGRAVITHEFFCAAGRGRAAAAVEALGPAEVHLVITARDTLGMLTAGWTEYVKNGGPKPLSAMPPAGGKAPEFSWRTWDLGDVLRRWGPAVPPERVHVIPMPGPGEPADRHWTTYAGVLGLSGSYAPAEGAANPALGVVQIELLRRINRELAGFRSPVDRGRWIRGYLAEGQLVHQEGERPAPSPEQVAECRRRADRAVALIERRGYHVVGDLDRLRVPATPRPGRSPETVSEGELVDAAAALVAGMLADVRELNRRR
jgi:hypothetical protein